MLSPDYDTISKENIEINVIFVSIEWRWKKKIDAYKIR